MFREFAWKLLFYFISVLLIAKDRLVEMFLSWYFGEKKTCPALNDDQQFLRKSAVDLAAAIRNGEITSTQLVTATIERMREVNGILNAIADGPFNEAIDEAKAIDERIANKQISNGN